MDDILTTVRSSLIDPLNSTSDAPHDVDMAVGAEAPEVEVYTEDAEGWEYDANDIVFDDTGEGAGVEGDLDVDDD